MKNIGIIEVLKLLLYFSLEKCSTFIQLRNKLEGRKTSHFWIGLIVHLYTIVSQYIGMNELKWRIYTYYILFDELPTHTQQERKLYVQKTLVSISYVYTF